MSRSDWIKDEGRLCEGRSIPLCPFVSSVVKGLPYAQTDVPAASTGGAPGAARAGAEADRPAASLLLPRDVPAAADQRAELGHVVAGFEGSHLLDGRVAVAPEDRLRRGSATHRWAGLRLPAGLVA